MQMRDVCLRTHACVRARSCTCSEMHFLSPVFIRVRRLRDLLSSLGITGTRAHTFSSTHVRNPSSWSSSHCHRPFTVRYAPARARHTRCNLPAGSSVLPMSPASSSFPSRFVFTCNYTRVEIYLCCPRRAYCKYSRASA